jgi:hypothetical protein
VLQGVDGAPFGRGQQVGMFGAAALAFHAPIINRHLAIFPTLDLFAPRDASDPP